MVFTSLPFGLLQLSLPGPPLPGSAPAIGPKCGSTPLNRR